jgi:thiamine-phosphate pyrophosphorylase
VRLPQPPLLVITDRHQARCPLEEVAEAAFAGGCRWLSLREKDLAPAQRATLLRRLVALGRAWDALVTVHEDVSAALAAAAPGVHLPGGASPAAARARLGEAALIGVSAHQDDDLGRLAAAGADYATLSPIFPSASKPGYGPAVGLAGLARATAAVPLPIIALGGLDGERAGACVAAGAAGVAVMGSVMTATDPAAVVAGLLETIEAALVARSAPGHSAAGSVHQRQRRRRQP